MRIKQREYEALLRNSLLSFIERSFCELNPTTPFLFNWHIAVIADALEKCRRGEIKRLIVTVPPRSLKSHSVSVAFVAWLLGNHPSAQIICASYAQELADKHAMDCRALMMSEFYQQIFPTRLSAQKHAISEFVTTENGFRMATSVGGGLTGRGAEILIIDDPLKPEEALSDGQRATVNDWYDHTLYTRLNNKRTGCIILIMQRLHEDDLVGHVLAQEDWTVLKFSAIAEEDESYEFHTPLGERMSRRRIGEALHPEREPLEVLGSLRKTLGEYNFAGQYQQTPAPACGGMIKKEWFKTYRSLDLPESFDLVFQSWDTANKAGDLNDFSVCTTWGKKGNNLYLLNVFRKRLEYPALKRAVREQATSFRVSKILIEDCGSGTSLIQDLGADGVGNITSCKPKRDKVLRMDSGTIMFENGSVYLPEQAHWLAEYVHELVTFPNGKFDDQVDSTSQALDWIKDYQRLPGIIEFYRREAERKKAEAEKPASYNFKNLPEGWP